MVVPQAADEGVVAAVAVQEVAQGVTGQGNGGGPFDQAASLDIGRQGVARRSQHPVVAGVQPFDDEVGGGIDEVVVVALAPGHVVHAAAADQGVVAVAAHQSVVAGAAVEGEGDLAAGQGVVANQKVEVGNGGDDIVEGVARGRAVKDRAFIAQPRVGGVHEIDPEFKVLDIGAQGVAVENGRHRIAAFAGIFDDGVAGMVHFVKVVAQSAHHQVGDLGSVRIRVDAAYGCNIGALMGTVRCHGGGNEAVVPGSPHDDQGRNDARFNRPDQGAAGINDLKIVAGDENC